MTLETKLSRQHVEGDACAHCIHPSGIHSAYLLTPTPTTRTLFDLQSYLIDKALELYKEGAPVRGQYRQEK